MHTSGIKMKNWQSSYEKNNYGNLFYSLVRIYKPKKIVELGTKTGYSAYHMAKGLFDNHFGTLDCYDLWENKPPKSCPIETAKKNLGEFVDIVYLHKRDVKGVDENYDSIDLLHIDLDNDGYLLEEVLRHWLPKVKLIIIEGGSEERDNAPSWMKDKKPIYQWLRENQFDFFTINPYPSITLIRGRK